MKPIFLILKLTVVVTFLFFVSTLQAQHLGMEFSDPEAPSHFQEKENKVQTRFERQKELIIELFSFLDDYEMHFREMKYLNVLGMLPNLKVRFAQAEKTFRRYEAKMNEELKIMGSLYFSRYQIFVGIGDILKNLRIDSGYKSALLRSGICVLNNYGQLLDQLKSSSGMTPAELGNLKFKIANIAKRNQKYSITSKYLELDGNKIPKGGQVMVLEIKNKRALVLYMGASPTPDQIEDWVSLRDLEKRTTWAKNNKDYYD